MSFLASRTRSAPEGVGKPVRRREDPGLVTGAGRYTGDVNLPGQAYASMVRSPHAHARILRIDTAPALATPGVLAVLTGADLVADGLKAISHRPVPTNPHEVEHRRDKGPGYRRNARYRRRATGTGAARSSLPHPMYRLVWCRVSWGTR